MVKVNRRLLPIKAHYFFFLAAMGPILPQLPVIGKQIGISPEIMGYITSVLPIFYILAKPFFGFIADYFTHFRKMVFVLLILGMSVSYAGFYFLPSGDTHAIHLEDNWNVSFNIPLHQYCNEKLLSESSLCAATRLARCADSHSNTSFSAYFTDIQSPAVANFNLSRNVEHLRDLYMCLPAAGSTNNDSFVTRFNGTCHFPAELQIDCLYNTFTFWLFVVLMSVGTVGFNVVNSISDAICFDMLGESEEGKYGAQRVWGTIGFGMAALLAGAVVDTWTAETVKSLTPALLFMLIFSGFDLLSVSKLKLPQLSSSESISKDVWQLVKQPPIAKFLVFALLAGILDSFIIYFMFWHLEDVAAATGYMSEIKLIEGCVVAAECLAGEVPFFFYSGKIIKKLGYVHTMSLCFFCYALRLGLISWIPNPWYLVLVETFFQGCTYALCYTCIVAYASAVAPPGTSATVQGLMAGMDDGLGFSIGSLIGGLAYKQFGGRTSFFYFSILAICTCVIHIIVQPSSRKQQYLPKAEYQAPTEQLKVSSVIKDESI